MKLRQASYRRRSGVALVVTLVILVLLAGLAVALLQTSGLERGTSKSVADKAKADLMAETAANAAMAQLVDSFTAFPDSATTWETINGNEGTVLYYHDKTPEAAIAAGTAAQLYVLPLISGGTAQPVASKSSALPTLTDTPVATANAYNFNHARFSGDKQGWIGSSPKWTSANSSPQVFRGQWVNLTDSDGRITGRYAFWMEDESFKTNTNYARDVLRGSNTLGVNASEIPLQGLLKVLNNADPDGAATAAVGFRNSFPGGVFFEYRAFNQVPGQSTLADDAKFEATIFSGTSNLSRSGSKRVNLNKIVSTSNDPKEIRKQLDEIISTISYELPNFAQRFYRNGSDKNSLDVASTGNPSHQTIYLNKIAANIRDYIDSDSQPTIVNSDLTVNVGSAPEHSLPGGGASGPNEVIAIGKEAVPFIQEYLVRVKQSVFSNRLGTSANYRLDIDHYVEVWNMTNSDITVASLGPNAFLRIANQFGWDANQSAGGNDIPESPTRDFSVPLSQFTNSNGTQLSFPAGAAIVLTTDPVALPATFPGIDASRVFRPPAGTPADPFRIYQGITKKKSGSNLRINSIPRPVNNSTSADLETEIILGNDNGVLESFGGPAVNYITANVDDGSSNGDSVRSDINQYYFRASSLKGNAASSISSQVGDPRTNNEQLSVTTSTADEDQTAYKLEAWNSPSQISNTTLTTLNTNYVNPSLWTDFATNTADAAHAPAVIANRALTSIGQLGDIFDSARSIGATPTGSGKIDYSRGGGRTLKIGQPERYDATTNPDGLWDGNSNSASREWTAWRVADIFGTTDSLQLDGRINVNGISRDEGTALKTALYGYNFQPTPDSDVTLSGKSFDLSPTDANDKINELVKQLTARLANDATNYGAAFANTVGPLIERGELSELPMFNTGSDLSTGVNTANVYDRGREELFRRIVELTTTRGNIFTIYAAGQSLVPQTGTAPPVITSTSQLKLTFRIDPIWTAGPPADPFDPTSNARFAKPDKYAVKILYVGD
jgi:Tfp pilus assembly protein PilX